MVMRVYTLGGVLHASVAVSADQSYKFISSLCHRSEVVDPVASQLYILSPCFLYNHDSEVFYGVSGKVLKWAATDFSIFLVLMSCGHCSGCARRSLSHPHTAYRTSCRWHWAVHALYNWPVRFGKCLWPWCAGMSYNPLCCISYSWTPLKWTLLGSPLCVCNMEVSIFQGLLVGVVMCTRAVEYNDTSALPYNAAQMSTFCGPNKVTCASAGIIYSKTSNNGPDILCTVDRSLAPDWFYHRTNIFRTSEKWTPLNSGKRTLAEPQTYLSQYKITSKNGQWLMAFARFCTTIAGFKDWSLY